MKIAKNLTLAALAALALTLLVQTPLSLFGDDDQQNDDHDQRLSITFHKCQTSPGILQGTVDGDCGPGTVFFLALPGSIVGTSAVQFAGEYTITTSECSFKAVCAGVRIISTGHIVLNGVVIEGPRTGDLVHVDAQLVIEQGVRCSEGTMTIRPSEPPTHR